MVKENKNEEKLCLFFASDYHFDKIIKYFSNIYNNFSTPEVDNTLL